MPGRAHVPPQKIERVQQLKRSLVERPMTALVGFRGVPAAALQRMRRELLARGHPILVAPNSALRHAIEESIPERPALKPLLDHLADQTALLTAEGNPFALFQELDRTRSPTPARGGETSPKDIFVPSGTTSFKPGPIVGELQHAGFPAAIEKGKVILKRDVTIVKKGQTISRELAGLLTRMDILPLEVGLDLRAVVDGDTFYPPEVLSVDLDARRADLLRAARAALWLAVEAGYPTAQTIPRLLARAHRRAIALAVEAGYPTKASLPALLGRAARGAAALRSLGAS